jgi:hypothetical protein
MNCAHEGCHCTVETQGGFCSDYCRDSMGAQHAGHACECGHPECTH